MEGAVDLSAADDDDDDEDASAAMEWAPRLGSSDPCQSFRASEQANTETSPSFERGSSLPFNLFEILEPKQESAQQQTGILQLDNTRTNHGGSVSWPSPGSSWTFGTRSP